MKIPLSADTSKIIPDKIRLTQIVFQKIIGDADGIRQKSASSRYLNGNVPNVNFNSNDGQVNVNNYNPNNSYGDLRARQKSPK